MLPKPNAHESDAQCSPRPAPMRPRPAASAAAPAACGQRSFQSNIPDTMPNVARGQQQCARGPLLQTLCMVELYNRAAYPANAASFLQTPSSHGGRSFAFLTGLEHILHVCVWRWWWWVCAEGEGGVGGRLRLRRTAEISYPLLRRPRESADVPCLNPGQTRASPRPHTPEQTHLSPAHSA